MRQSQLISLLAEAAAELAESSEEPRIASPLRQEWTAGSEGNSQDAQRSSSVSGRMSQLDGTLDSVNSAFLNMERRSLEGLWK